MKVQSKTTRLYLAGFFLLMLALIVFAQAAFNLDQFFSPSEPTQIVLLYTLSTFIFLVLLIFGFVLLRAVVKVWIERKQQKPGSKFKTSLLVSLISLTSIPAVFLFLFAFSLLNRSIVKWFSVPVDQIFNATVDMNAEWQREHEALAHSILAHIGRAQETEPDVAGTTLAGQIRARLYNRTEAFFDIEPYWIDVQRTGAGKNSEIIAALF